MEPPKNPPPPPQSDQQPPSKKPKMTSSSTTTTSDDETTTKAHRYKRRKVAIFFAYCGVGYQGMQKNPGAKTIEGDLEEALFFSGAVPEADRGQHKRFDLARSARTDKGVSAVGQVVSGRFYVDPPGFVHRLNSNLNPQIRVFGFKRVTPSFNAKKFCDRRRYVYLLPVFALDPSIHRDRESVMASLGSDNELVKCFECSERGRKVLGLMGNKRDLVGFHSGISSNTCGAGLNGGECDTGSVVSSDNVGDTIVSNDGAEKIERTDNVESDVTLKDDSEVFVHSGISSNTEAALLSREVNETERSNVTSDENGVAELKSESVAMEEEGKEVKRSEFKYDEEVKDRFNRILKHYVGTHNFHNFTTRTKAEDPSAKRYIVSFEANTTITIDGMEFVKCEVVGQSFMLHQIRKMMGMAVSVMRNFVPESIYDRAFDQDFRINVPTAPEVGLYLDECMFTSYNNKWKNTHEEISMKDYAQEAEEFKFKYIYSHIAKTEQKEGSVAVWLHSLNHRNYPELRLHDGEVVGAADGEVGRKTDVNVESAADDMCPRSGEVERLTDVYVESAAGDMCPRSGEVEGLADDQVEQTTHDKVGNTAEDNMERADDDKLARVTDDKVARTVDDEPERAAEDMIL